MLLRTLLLAALAAALRAEDSLDVMVAKTDMTNVEQVSTLAQWCKDHNRPDHARQYWRLAIRLDPDNEQAHSELGQVRDGDRWVTVVNRAGAPEATADKASSVAGPAPTAAQVSWDLAIPRDPAPDSDFVDSYIAKLPTIKNDSNEMDSAVATMLMDENLPSALPRLCRALDKPDYNDLYGAANVVMGLSKAGRLDTARPLLPHLVKGTTHCTDDDDIAAALFAIGLFQGKRAVHRASSGSTTARATASRRRARTPRRWSPPSPRRSPRPSSRPGGTRTGTPIRKRSSRRSCTARTPRRRSAPPRRSSTCATRPSSRCWCTSCRSTTARSTPARWW